MAEGSHFGFQARVGGGSRLATDWEVLGRLDGEIDLRAALDVPGRSGEGDLCLFRSGGQSGVAGGRYQSGRRLGRQPWYKE